MNVKQLVALNYNGAWISLDANDYFVSYFNFKGTSELHFKNVNLWVSSGVMTINQGDG